jgi:hypothetical protein
MPAVAVTAYIIVVVTVSAVVAMATASIVATALAATPAPVTIVPAGGSAAAVYSSPTTAVVPVTLSAIPPVAATATAVTVVPIAAGSVSAATIAVAATSSPTAFRRLPLQRRELELHCESLRVHQPGLYHLSPDRAPQRHLRGRLAIDPGGHRAGRDPAVGVDEPECDLHSGDRPVGAIHRPDDQRPWDGLPGDRPLPVAGYGDEPSYGTVAGDDDAVSGACQ